MNDQRIQFEIKTVKIPYGTYVDATNQDTILIAEKCATCGEVYCCNLHCRNECYGCRDAFYKSYDSKEPSFWSWLKRVVGL